MAQSPPPYQPANGSPIYFPPVRRSLLFPTLDFSEPIPACAGKLPLLLPDESFQSSLPLRTPEEKGTPSNATATGKSVTEGGKKSKSKMADPFEVRVRFTSQLQHLNASVTSAQKAANYALKYRDMDEDLHSCILEQLERNNMNNRANILYFIEHFVDSAIKENHLEFVRMMQRDILRVVDAVAPPDGSGAANVKIVRKVLASLAAKSVLQVETVAEIEECLKERETHPAHHGLSPMETDENGVGEEEDAKKGKVNGVGTPMKFDKRQIEQRIEEDRERNKRLREGMWAVPGEDDFEVQKMWDEGSDLGEDDEILAMDELAERNGMRE